MLIVHDMNLTPRCGNAFNEYLCDNLPCLTELGPWYEENVA